MILVVEIPRSGKPACWFAFDEADFIRKVRLTRKEIDGVVFQVETPRRLLGARGASSDSPGAQEQHADLLQLAAANGWDGNVYRADYLLAPGHYQSEEVSEFLKSCRVYPDEEQAMDSLYGDPLYEGHEGFYAHMALREQLIALEVISDDL
jgi:hypothetical protein